MIYFFKKINLVQYSERPKIKRKNMKQRCRYLGKVKMTASKEYSQINAPLVVAVPAFIRIIRIFKRMNFITIIILHLLSVFFDGLSVSSSHLELLCSKPYHRNILSTFVLFSMVPTARGPLKQHLLYQVY